MTLSVFFLQGYEKSLIYQLLPFMFDFHQHCEDNDLSSSSSFVLVISPLNALMIDQITKLKDHVNVSILKAVHVDESKDAMYIRDNSVYGQRFQYNNNIWTIYRQRFQ